MVIEKANEILLQEEIKRPREPAKYWPSQASIILPNGEIMGECLRKSFYEINAIPITNPTSIRIKRAMLYGKKIEEAEIELLKERGILLGEQVLFIKEYKIITIRGKIDAVVFEDGKNKGVEYKSGGGYYFQSEIWGTTTKPGGPKVSNLLQVMLYLDGYKEHKELNFDKVALIYIERGMCDTQEFTIQLDSGFPLVNGEIDYSLNVQDIYKRYIILDKYMRTNKLPPCDYCNYYSPEEITNMYYKNIISKKKYNLWKKLGYGADWQCQYCKYLNKCKEDSLIT